MDDFFFFFTGLIYRLLLESIQVLRSFSYKKNYRGCMLNTSFNLHGLPIVNNLTEAFYVMNNSSLDGLITDRYLILK